MSMSPRTLLLLAVLLPLAACQELDVAVRVMAHKVPSAALTLEATVAVDDVPKPPVRLDLSSVQKQSDVSFGVWLASGTTGTVSVALRAIDGTGCAGAVGAAATP